MKKQLKLLSLLVVVIFGTFSLANKMVFFPANATYVEGLITQDTVWTLTDSPFVVSKNITVQNARLTIEPGVEVRFGGYFSIFVEGSGSLYAVGTQNNNITFTSNKDQPKAGDWDTIKFNGTAISTLAYCALKYATNAMTIKNSTVEIRNSEISTSSQNGITIENSVVDAQDNTISDNLKNGFYVTGASKATIQSNTIRANANGVFLTGDSTMKADIIRNIVLSNSQSGIYLDMNDYSNIVILYNVLSANNKGFYVSGRTSTQISNNSISYNSVGIFYDKASHIARWNDIYANGYGMDVSTDLSVIVNAEYNYWGDESGPYHVSLNPAGKGNPVGGNGYNLDFTFFLTAPIGYLNQRPVARLLTDKTLVAPVNQVVWFVATNSSDDRQVDQYLYDFGDGTNSGWTTLSIFVHKYSFAGTYTARVTVRDDFDVTSTNTANVDVTVEALTAIDVSLTLGRSTVISEGQVSITVRTSVGSSNIRLLSVAAGSLEISFGSTNSTGYFTTILAVPKVNEQTDVRIIAAASKSGYADGSDYKYLQVLPPLSVHVTPDPSVIRSEATSNVIVHVTHNANPISGVDVRMSSDTGSFSPQTGLTDLNGSFAFTFIAPQTMAQVNVSITATATKTGYFESTGETRITVNPRVLTVEVRGSSGAVESEASLNMTVHVTDDAKPIAGANVMVSSNLGGDFSATTGTTDSDGMFKVLFFAPKTTTQVDVTIMATATKSGYVDGENQTKVIVSPIPGAGASLPWMLILLISIPIIVVVIVAVLIKKRILIMSRE